MRPYCICPINTVQEVFRKFAWFCLIGEYLQDWEKKMAQQLFPTHFFTNSSCCGCSSCRRSCWWKSRNWFVFVIVFQRRKISYKVHSWRFRWSCGPCRPIDSSTWCKIIKITNYFIFVWEIEIWEWSRSFISCWNFFLPGPWNCWSSICD